MNSKELKRKRFAEHQARVDAQPKLPTMSPELTAYIEVGMKAEITTFFEKQERYAEFWKRMRKHSVL